MRRLPCYFYACLGDVRYLVCPFQVLGVLLVEGLDSGGDGYIKGRYSSVDSFLPSILSAPHSIPSREKIPGGLKRIGCLKFSLKRLGISTIPCHSISLPSIL